MIDPRFTQLATWTLPGLAALGGLALGLLVRRTVMTRLARAAAKSEFKYDDVLVDAVKGPVVLWFVLIGVRIALRLLPLESRLDLLLGKIVLVLGIFSVAWAVARFIEGALKAGAGDGALPGVSLLANVGKAVVYIVGALIVLQGLGISVTPIITALGVGGLAIGLALQDTLTNFFAGIRILAAGKIRPGDFIRLESGQEGLIMDISWAQTTIQQLPNNIVIVPNSKLATAITTNFSLPQPEQAVVLQVGVSYASDLEHVERVTIEVARQVQQEVEGATRTHEPWIRYHTFGDSSINFNVSLRADEHANRFPIVHAFIKRLHARYRSEGIEIPFPIRTVIMKPDGGG